MQLLQQCRRPICRFANLKTCHITLFESVKGGRDEHCGKCLRISAFQEEAVKRAGHCTPLSTTLNGHTRGVGSLSQTCAKAAAHAFFKVFFVNDDTATAAGESQAAQAPMPAVPHQQHEAAEPQPSPESVAERVTQLRALLQQLPHQLPFVTCPFSALSPTSLTDVPPNKLLCTWRTSLA
jgi:hypothetical protein